MLIIEVLKARGYARDDILRCAQNDVEGVALGSDGNSNLVTLLSKYKVGDSVKPAVIAPRQQRGERCHDSVGRAARRTVRVDRTKNKGQVERST
jgi:hypothetical protein